jgi:hypothetical protein
MEDYFGQLGTIRGVIAESDLDVKSVRTFDVDGQNGFIIQMVDLLNFYHDRLDAEEYRSRWVFFEP